MKKYVTVIAALALVLSGCQKKEEPVAVAAEAAPTYTVADTMAAMLRGHSHSKQICYDEGMNGWYILYTEDATMESPFNGGWLYISEVKFYRSSNKTWFITDQKITDYTHVYPDVTGMNCKTQ